MANSSSKTSVGLGEPLLHVASLEGERLAAHEVAAFVYRRRAREHRLHGIGDKRQRLIAHFDQPQRLLRGVLVYGGNRGHLVADVPHFSVQDRQVGGDAAVGHVERCQYCVHAGMPGRRGGIDREDARVRVRAAQNLAMQHPRQPDIGSEFRFSGELLRQVAPWHGDADVCGGHVRLRLREQPRCLPDRRNDAAVGVAAADVAG